MIFLDIHAISVNIFGELMSRKIIGISGFISSGKGTVGNILAESYGFERVSYADRLKDVVATLFDWDRDLLAGDTPESRSWREQPDEWWTNELGYKFSPRNAMQRVGTDCMRKGLDDNVWVKIVKKQILENPETDFVIPDIRFFNERDLVKQLGGEVWRVKKGPDPAWIFKAINDNRYDTNWMSEHPEVHESEWRWIDEPTEFDRVILNDSGFQELKKQVKIAMGSD